MDSYRINSRSLLEISKVICNFAKEINYNNEERMNFNKVLNEINKLYGDTSRSPEETLEDLEALRDELDVLIDTL